MQMEKQSTFRSFVYSDLGVIDFSEAWGLQKSIVQEKVDAATEKDFFFLLEHPNTYTLGRTAKKEHLLGDDQYLRKNNISVHEIDRGGDITYHGPGQIVGYPIIDLSRWSEDTHKYLRTLEEVIIRACTDAGLACMRNAPLTGVWVEDRKLASIGVKVTRWITMHGFALNVKTDLSLFDGIIPCGIRDKAMTSIENELGFAPNMGFIKDRLVYHFHDLFGYAEHESIESSMILEDKQNVLAGYLQTHAAGA